MRATKPTPAQPRPTLRCGHKATTPVQRRYHYFRQCERESRRRPQPIGDSGTTCGPNKAFRVLIRSVNRHQRRLRSTERCYGRHMTSNPSPQRLEDPIAATPARFGIRDLRNHTSRVLAEAERSGAVDITRNGQVIARLTPHRDEPDTRSPVRRLLDRIDGHDPIDTGWAHEYEQAKQAELAAQRDHEWA